ncbi:MAG: TVP38/TMEM64 family protein [Dehalococcoidia bacterium]|nr:TVP38/TMEM64 family protein [Dehalococcoidia bacterium]
MTPDPRANADDPLEEFFFETEETPLLLRKRVLAGLVLSFLAIAGAYAYATTVHDVRIDIDARPFQDWIDSLGIWGPLAFIAVMAVSVLFAPIPNPPVFIAAGLAWGTVLGTIYSLAGLMLGSAMAFWIARRMGRKWLPRLVGRRTAARIDRLADSMGGQLVFWARMLPVVNFDWISYLAGMTAMPFRSYFAWSALGMVLPTFVAVGAGDGLGRDFGITLAWGGVWLAAILLSAAYLFWRRRRWQQRKAEEAASEDSVQSSVQIGVD